MTRTLFLAASLAFLSTPAAFSDPADDALAGAMQADRDFAAMAARDGLGEAFRHYATSDARLIGPNSDDIVGPDAIAAARQLPEGAILHWDPRGGYAGEAGDFAVTYGSWGFYPDGNRDADPAATGDYITVWRLENGEWRYVLDGGNSDTPQPPAADTE
ncbi:YybH family protein [Hyphobacterium marinum]|uniref:Nuclear transport factor 2 family protein n=1 Tax=Hyphobacterium marinum TaxID=3116574 RepID=A0ABU7LZH6_9PROT|nr:nuclear transport factor 2 family protein [Hyphobacterium sp. Y6023]MEE2566966.1 nuclear transport factor 2 family protein [Hyphobacterium sp. Y6023]